MRVSLDVEIRNPVAARQRGFAFWLGLRPTRVSVSAIDKVAARLSCGKDVLEHLTKLNDARTLPS